MRAAVAATALLCLVRHAAADCSQERVASCDCDSYGDGWTSVTLDTSIDFTLYHKVVDQTIHIRLSGRTSGWVGFGIGEPTSGHMKGADLMTAYCVGPTCHLQDRYADFAATDDSGYGYPDLWAHVDQNNDWTLVSGYEVEGITHIYATRPLLTGDAQDRPIGAGPTRIVWAWGSNDEVQHHGSHRGPQILTFIAAPTSEVTALSSGLPPYDGVISRRMRRRVRTGCHFEAVVT